MKKPLKKVPSTPGLGKVLIKALPRKSCKLGSCNHTCKIGCCTLDPHAEHYHTSKTDKREKR